MIWKFKLSLNNGNNNTEQLISIQIDTGNCNVIPLMDIDRGIERTLSFQEFMKSVIQEKKNSGHLRTSECYICALNSFEKYLRYHPVDISEINSAIINGYEGFLKDSNICMNSISFYMRILKAVYNRAVKQKLVDDRKPFAEVYTGVAKTRKRSVDIETIRLIKRLSPTNDDERMARNLFLFSFYTRGMAFVDMAYLQKKDLINGILTYSRRKTGQMISIKWEKAMQDILDDLTPSANKYLLPIIREEGKTERCQYRYLQYKINRQLRNIGIRLGLKDELTMYVARHSWASIAKSINVPLDIIRESLGHSSEKMTSIYLKTIDESKMHNENARIIQLTDY